MEEVLVGVVDWFDPKKGYGYITRGEGVKDIFVHWSNIVMEGFKTLHPGDEVEYKVGDGEQGNHKGAQAIEVRVVKKANR